MPCPPRNPLPLAILGALCLFFTLACAEESSPTRTPAGGEAAPERLRIASMSPALSEMVRAMGAGDTLVGRHGFDHWSDPALPIVGDQTGYDYETLLTLDPTHVLIEERAEELPGRLERFAADNGWTLLTLPTLSLEDVVGSAERIAELTGGREAFESWQGAWNRAMTPVRDAAGERPLILIGTAPPAALGPGSVHFAMLERLGAEPVPSAGASYQRLSLEDVIGLDPTCIVLLSPDAPASDPIELIGALDRLRIRAVTDRRIIVVREPMALIPSTSLLGTAEALRAGFEGLE